MTVDAAHDQTRATKPRASESIVADLMMPHQANGLKRPSVFGGVIMSMVDRCAAIPTNAGLPSYISTTRDVGRPCRLSSWKRRKTG